MALTATADDTTRRDIVRLLDLNDPLIQVSSFESICLLVEAGVGIGIIPRSSALRHARLLKLHTVALSDDWARRESKIVTRAGAPLPRLAQALVLHLANFQFEERLL